MELRSEIKFKLIALVIGFHRKYSYCYKIVLMFGVLFSANLYFSENITIVMFPMADYFNVLTYTVLIITLLSERQNKTISHVIILMLC